jgi:hypothetical protein
MESMLIGSEVNPHILTNSALAKQRKVCGVCQLRPRMAGANWCEQCRDALQPEPRPRSRKRSVAIRTVPTKTAESVLKKPTEFEDLVIELGLSESEYDHSPKLVKWVRANRNRRYVPEWLLTELGIEVDVKFAF